MPLNPSRSTHLRKGTIRVKPGKGIEIFLRQIAVETIDESTHIYLTISQAM